MRFGQGLGAAHEPGFDRRSRLLDGGCGRRRLQRAGVGIDDHGGAVGDVADSRTQADQHGNVHGGRQDRHVRGGAAAAQADGDQARTVERGQFRRQQIVGDQHGSLGQWDVHRPRFAGERQQHMRFHVEQVIDPFAQARILECLERTDRPADRGAPGEAGALARGDRFMRCLVHLRIVEELQVRGDDFAAGGPARRGHAFEPHTDIDPRLFQFSAFSA